MKKIALLAPGKLELQDASAEIALKDGMVKVRVSACGVCGSDLALLNGTRDMTKELYFGHEAVALRRVCAWRASWREPADVAGTAATDCRSIAGA